MSDVTPRARGAAARRARTDARLADVVAEQLVSHGYAGLTIERVSVESGVAKTTIYRRWASKAEMVFDLAIHRADQAEPPDSGTLADDVAALADRAVALVTGEPGRDVLPGLLADMAQDAELTRRLHQSFIVAARGEITAVLDRAVTRGEVSPGIDVEGFHAALLGIPYARVHLLGHVDASRLAETLTDQLLALLGTTRTT